MSDSAESVNLAFLVRLAPISTTSIVSVHQYKQHFTKSESWEVVFFSSTYFFLVWLFNVCLALELALAIALALALEEHCA